MSNEKPAKENWRTQPRLRLNDTQRFQLWEFIKRDWEGIGPIASINIDQAIEKYSKQVGCKVPPSSIKRAFKNIGVKLKMRSSPRKKTAKPKAKKQQAEATPQIDHSTGKDCKGLLEYDLRLRRMSARQARMERDYQLAKKHIAILEASVAELQEHIKEIADIKVEIAELNKLAAPFPLTVTDGNKKVVIPHRPEKDQAKSKDQNSKESKPKDTKSTIVSKPGEKGAKPSNGSATAKP